MTTKTTTNKSSKAPSKTQKTDAARKTLSNTVNSPDEETVRSKGPALDLPEGDSLEIEPSRLLLDPMNLRLLERVGETFGNLEVELFGQPSIQDKLFNVINSDPRFDISSLAASIVHNGFLRHERLIVARYDGNKFLVLEGNRRVSAVRKLIE
ncbi:hypothetical protein [Methylomonas fluvii]|uniref:ParB/Sulfiredoxin domain-containing protein n=1 Tax=Methylomonas fluvii TaxID=1854564 RepID=A0ABR9DKZ6_9GAMM|nr:hypothetical protein [Methylomonas fluvii]MBD9363008.1 hypothetical protein [Methylomonas fluvii]CAD6876209.1 hypothetical protein [Methylomonas fluvii]